MDRGLEAVRIATCMLELGLGHRSPWWPKPGEGSACAWLLKLGLGRLGAHVHIYGTVLLLLAAWLGPGCVERAWW